MYQKKKCLMETDCRIICPECGGRGEIINDNHLIADISWEYRYMPCSRCFGIGTVPRKNSR